MKRFQGLAIIAAGCLIFAIACAGAAQSQKNETDKEQIVSLTIVPVMMLEEPHQNVAEALGLMLEKNGFRKLKIMERTFEPEKEMNIDELASAFGKFVAKFPIKTEHALFCEFKGSPKEGVDAVRSVVVDKKGKVFWKEEQTSTDPEFLKYKPSNPMACIVFVTERLRPNLKMASPDEMQEEGEMAKLWARKSGTPDKKEFEAMDARLDKMRKVAREASVTVYPIRLGEKTNQQGGEHLVSLLNDGKLCRAKIADKPLWFEVKPDSNEQRVLWDMAKAFQAHVRKNKPKTDYALYGDYLISSRGDKVGCVHFVVCDRMGEFVIVDFQNDHHDDFQAINPKSLEDCNRLAAKRLKGYLR